MFLMVVVDEKLAKLDLKLSNSVIKVLYSFFKASIESTND